MDKTTFDLKPILAIIFSISLEYLHTILSLIAVSLSIIYIMVKIWKELKS